MKEMKPTMNAEQFGSKLTQFTTDFKAVKKLATTLAIEAVANYRTNNDWSWVAQLHEEFAQQQSSDLRAAFEKLVWASTNLHFSQDESDLSKPVECVPQTDQEPKPYVSILEAVKADGLLGKYGPKKKSKQSASRLNRNGAKAVKEIGGAPKTDDSEMTEAQKANKEALDKFYKEQVGAILAGKFDESALSADEQPTTVAGSNPIVLGNESNQKELDKFLSTVATIGDNQPEAMGNMLRHINGQAENLMKKALAAITGRGNKAA